jgi:hypothetical protein
MPTKTLTFAGRKLVALVFCTSCMVLTAVSTLSMTAVHMLDGTFAQNLTVTVVGGICTLYATFVGGNYGEHIAKARFLSMTHETQQEGEEPDKPPEEQTAERTEAQTA